MSEPAFTRIVVLGHTGYIGSRLVPALAAIDPRIPVVGRSLHDLDLTRPESAAELESLLDPDSVVVILAAIKKQLGDSLEVFSQNLAITLTICRALASRPVRRIVFFSSAAVYGEDVQHGIISETTAVRPTSFYGIGKSAAEQLLRRAVEQHRGPERAAFLVLRPALVYGPDEPAYYYGPSGFLRKALAHEPITLWGDGTELREFLFVDDVVELTAKLTFSDATGVLNIVSGVSYTYAEALDAVAALTGVRPAVTSRPRTKDQVDHRFDPAALLAARPGFRFTSMTDGLKTIAAARQAEKAQI